MLGVELESSNVAEALRITRAPGVDVSSGVERAPGKKDPEKIRGLSQGGCALTELFFSPPLQLGETSIVRSVK